MDSLPKEDRLSLMRFVCSFAWADFEIQDEERTFIGKLIAALELEPDEKKLVAEWLKVPPRPEEVDPTDVPRRHRELFLATVKAVVMADGVLDPDEEENLKLFTELLGG
ncbi:MAG: TerB family tellurite resistance protein [bacterium]